jgi:hypothetical protein
MGALRGVGILRPEDTTPNLSESFAEQQATKIAERAHLLFELIVSTGHIVSLQVQKAIDVEHSPQFIANTSGMSNRSRVEDSKVQVTAIDDMETNKRHKGD